MTLSMCSVKMTVDLLGKGAKVVKECRKRGEFSSFSSQFFSPSELSYVLPGGVETNSDTCVRNSEGKEGRKDTRRERQLHRSIGVGMSEGLA